MAYDLLIRGGKVSSPAVHGVADIAVSNGTITAIGDLRDHAAQEVLDASEMLVFPGGIDPHTHIHWPFLESTTVDDFRTASIAAFLGGTTTIVDWALPTTQDLATSLGARIDVVLNQGVLVDFALHSVLSPDIADHYADMQRVVSHGAVTFKCYLTYRRRGLLTNDAQLLAALRAAADLGAVIGVHAENAELHEAAEAHLRNIVPSLPSHFRTAKDNLVEAEAVNRAIFLARAARAPLLIQHVSTAEAVELVRGAQRSGWPIFAETCPHYLVLTDEVYHRKDGRRFICSPPMKGRSDLEALWQGIAEGVISIVGADHCAFSTQQKDAADSVFDVPNGLPGIQTRVPILYSEGVAAGRIDEATFRRIIAENPAKMVGVFPRKGILAVGADADLTIIDPSARYTITAKDLKQGSDWTPYEGMELTGRVRFTLRRGTIVVADGTFQGGVQAGQFLKGVPGGYSAI